MSQWGHDFRPDYRQLDCLAERLPGRAAHGADGDGRRADAGRDPRAICSSRRPNSFVAGFDRPNIRYAIAREGRAAAAAPRRFSRRTRARAASSTACRKRKTEETAAWLTRPGLRRARLPRRAATRRARRATSGASSARTAWSWSRRSPSAWASTSRTCASSPISTCRGASRPTTRRPAAPAATGCRPRPDALRLQDIALRRSFIDESDAPDERQARRAPASSTRCSGCAETGQLPPPGRCSAISARACEPCGNCDTCLEPPEMFDGTEAAQKALSCIYRTGQRFGAGLYRRRAARGRPDERMQRFGHDALSTSASARSTTAQHWRSILRQLDRPRVSSAVDLAGHGGLSISDEGRRVPAREAGARAAQAAPTARRAGRKRAPRRPPPSTWRRTTAPCSTPCAASGMEIARDHGVPPYVIFHDRTLLEMASARPATLRRWRDVSGVGQAKLDRYGHTFLAVIAEHAAAGSG